MAQATLQNIPRGPCGYPFQAFLDNTVASESDRLIVTSDEPTFLQDARLRLTSNTPALFAFTPAYWYRLQIFIRSGSSYTYLTKNGHDIVMNGNDADTIELFFSDLDNFKPMHLGSPPIPINPPQQQVFSGWDVAIIAGVNGPALSADQLQVDLELFLGYDVSGGVR